MSSQELGDFQKKKILHVFTTFFDVNNDGVIGLEDFEMFVERIRSLHNWPVDGARHRKASQTCRLIWEGLKHHADANLDEKISKAEWLRMWTECLKAYREKQVVQDWQQHYMNLMFDVNDTSGDADIDKEEYTTVYTTYGLTRAECARAFDTFSKDGRVNRELFGALWLEYFTSEDPDSPGSNLFGVIN